jgi:hypothetical protein
LGAGGAGVGGGGGVAGGVGGGALVAIRGDGGGRRPATSGELSLALVPQDGAGGAKQKQSFSADEIMTYGRHLGINPVFEPDLLWIAEQALGAPLPPNWLEHATPAVRGGSSDCLLIVYPVLLRP